jgi:hypothetical protein
VDISMSRVIRYLASLDYTQSTAGRLFSLGETMPHCVVLTLRHHLADGRTVIGAELSSDYHLRLIFGPRDAAVASYS